MGRPLQQQLNTWHHSSKDFDTVGFVRNKKIVHLPYPPIIFWTGLPAEATKQYTDSTMKMIHNAHHNCHR